MTHFHIKNYLSDLYFSLYSLLESNPDHLILYPFSSLNEKDYDILMKVHECQYELTLNCNTLKSILDRIEGELFYSAEKDIFVNDPKIVINHLAEVKNKFTSLVKKVGIWTLPSEEEVNDLLKEIEMIKDVSQTIETTYSSVYE